MGEGLAVEYGAIRSSRRMSDVVLVSSGILIMTFVLLFGLGSGSGLFFLVFLLFIPLVIVGVLFVRRLNLKEQEQRKTGECKAEEYNAIQSSGTIFNIVASLCFMIGQLIGVIVVFFSGGAESSYYGVGFCILFSCSGLSSLNGCAHYYITETSLILLNMAGDTKEYGLSDILRIEGPLKKKDLRGIARYLLSARKGNVIRITFTNGKTFYCSPKEKEEFLEVLQERTGIPVSGSPLSLKGPHEDVINQV
jgi:hypothetical protein